MLHSEYSELFQTLELLDEIKTVNTIRLDVKWIIRSTSMEFVETDYHDFIRTASAISWHFSFIDFFVEELTARKL